MGLSNCMMEPLIPLKKLSNHEFVEHHPKKTRKITSFFFQRSLPHRCCSDFGIKMHNILKLSVGRKYFLFFWPAVGAGTLNKVLDFEYFRPSWLALPPCLCSFFFGAHLYITSAKMWVDGVRNMKFLLIYSTIYTVVGGWVSGL